MVSRFSASSWAALMLVISAPVTSCGEAKLKAEVEAKIEVTAAPKPEVKLGSRVIKPFPDSIPQSAGLIVFKPLIDIDLDSVEGYVVGFPDTLKIEASTEDRFFIKNVPAGSQSLLIEGKTKGGTSVSRIFSDVKTLNGAQTDLDVSSLGTSNSESKKITLADIKSLNPLSGALISVIGTKLTARNNGNGNYEFDSLPKGKLNITAEIAGYRRAYMMQITTSEIRSKMLLTSSLGSMGLIEFSDLTKPGEMELVISPPDDTDGYYDEMRMAIDSEISNTTWKPLRTSFSTILPSGKSYSMNLQFRKSWSQSSTSEVTNSSVNVGSVPTAVYGRSLSAIIGLENILIFAGGLRTALPQIWQPTVSTFDSTKRSWDASVLPANVAFPSGASSADNAYAIVAGGGSFNIFNAKTSQWTTAGMAITRINPEVITVNDSFFIIGGETVYSDVVEKVFPSTMVTETFLLPEGRARAKAAFCGDKIFVAGGQILNGAYSNRVDIFDTTTSTWQQMNLSEGKAPAFAHVAMGNVVIGGGFNQTGRLKSVDLINCNNLEIRRTYLPSFIIENAVFDDGKFLNFFSISPTSGIAVEHLKFNLESLEFSSSQLPSIAIGVSGKATRFRNLIIFEGPRIFDRETSSWSTNLY